MSDFGIGAGVNALVRRVHGRKDRLHAQYMQEREWGRQDTEIQRRVADAQAAGIHPLFALGANVGSGGGAMTLMEEPPPDYGAAVKGAIEGVRGMDERTRAKEYSDAQIAVMKSEAARNDAAAKDYNQSALARAAQLSNQLRSPPDVIAPRGQVGTPGVDGRTGGKIERFGTPLGYLDADKRFADSEEVERRWGDLAQEFYGTGLMLHEGATNIHNKYSDYMDRVLNPSTPIRSMDDWNSFRSRDGAAGTFDYPSP